jgi:hypothetical protein
MRIRALVKKIGTQLLQNNKLEIEIFQMQDLRFIETTAKEQHHKKYKDHMKVQVEVILEQEKLQIGVAAKHMED